MSSTRKMPVPITGQKVATPAVEQLIPLRYGLSIGPAYRLLPGPWLPTVYRPLVQLENHCKLLDRFLTWCMEDVWKCGMW
jgi:hypothetical protein